MGQCNLKTLITTSTGATGAAGTNGTNGTNGTDGAQGLFGGFSGEWLFSTNTLAPPNSTYVEFNNATPALVTSITLHYNNADSTDYSSFLNVMIAQYTAGGDGLIKIFKKDFDQRNR